MVQKTGTNVSIRDMVNSTNKCNDNWGIKGYEYGRPLHPSFPGISEKPTSINKPLAYSITKDNGKPMDYFSML